MKTKSIIIAGLSVLLSTAFFASNAQSAKTEIKVLPTTKEGIVKLLVVGSANEVVDVAFYNQQGLVETQTIKSDTDGFNKRYDVRQIIDPGFSMEVSSAGTSVTYKLAKAKGRLIPYLVKQTNTYPIVASKN
ncbi:MAG: hypothetical protein WDO15_14965 [Bacteroidota bacterium]